MDLNIIRGGQCEVAVVEHSLNTHTNKELVTYQLKYPRFIHAEFMTHRMFSRNASSSRAIPTSKLLAQVRNDPAFFVWVGENQPGMQAKAEVDLGTKHQFYEEWKELAGICAAYAERWANEYNVHKQSANRVLEPFTYISVVVTATEWDNWNELRDHEDAQPEIQDLAQTMKIAYSQSKARHLVQRNVKDPRDWHLPYVTMEERKYGLVHNLLAESAARCARSSYLTHNKENPKLEDDIALYERLVKSVPLHASPLEHQACVSKIDHRSQNLLGGWIQHRFMLEKCGSLDNLRMHLALPE